MHSTMAESDRWRGVAVQKEAALLEQRALVAELRGLLSVEQQSAAKGWRAADKWRRLHTSCANAVIGCVVLMGLQLIVIAWLWGGCR